MLEVSDNWNFPLILFFPTDDGIASGYEPSDVGWPFRIDGICHQGLDYYL